MFALVYRVVPATRGYTVGCQNGCEPFGHLTLKCPSDERTPAMSELLLGVLSSQGAL